MDRAILLEKRWRGDLIEFDEVFNKRRTHFLDVLHHLLHTFIRYQRRNLFLRISM